MTEQPHASANRSWVAVVGWSPMAVVNTIWESCERGVVPDRVILLVSPDISTVQRSAAVVEKYLRAILPHFNVKAPRIKRRPINEDDFLGFRDALAQVLQDERRQAAHVVVDTTPGRKYMSAFSLRQGQRTDLKVERVYYNHMLEQRYNDLPHPLIPRHEQQLYDFLEVLARR